MTLSDVKDAVPMTNRVLGNMHHTQKFWLSAEKYVVGFLVFNFAGLAL